MPHVTMEDLMQLGDLCNTICFHLTAHLAAVQAGVPSGLPPEVAQIYQLASKLPKPSTNQWQAVAKQEVSHHAGGDMALALGAKEPRKRLKWTDALEDELVQLVDDEEFRREKLGKGGSRGGNVNWSSVARHFGFSSMDGVQKRYCDIKGLPLKSLKKERKAADVPDSEKPAKKAKVKKEEPAAAATEPAPAAVAAPAAAPAAAAPAAAAPTSAKKKKKEAAAAATPAAAAAAAPAAAPASAAEAVAPTPGGGEGWTKKQEAELVQLVEDEDQRKAVLGKKKLRWKRIAEHFGKKVKSCRKHYGRLTSKDAPSDEE